MELLDCQAFCLGFWVLKGTSHGETHYREMQANISSLCSTLMPWRMDFRNSSTCTGSGAAFFRRLTGWANLLELQQLPGEDVPHGVISRHLEPHSDRTFSSSAPEVLQRVLCGWTRNPYCQQAPRFSCFCGVRTDAGGGGKSGYQDSSWRGL